MTHQPEFDVNERSPGVWKEVRRLEAEVERLRKEKAGLWRDREAFVEREARLRGENERLRRELDDKRLSRYEPAYVGDLEEENERLREEIADLLGDGFPALADQPTEEKA